MCEKISRVMLKTQIGTVRVYEDQGWLRVRGQISIMLCSEELVRLAHNKIY